MLELSKDEILRLATEKGLRRALVVTALPLEMRAVRAHIRHLGSVPGRSGTVYECGQFSSEGNEWLVVVADSGAGTHPAQQTVTNAHIDFDEFEVAFFVGIAGSRKPEAPIGSVVASSYLYYPYSGKHDPKLGFITRPHSLPVDPHLLGYARKVERDEAWVSRIRDPLRDKLVEGSDYPQPYPPLSFIAAIASIEAVSADPGSTLEDTITKSYGDALAVEMEGYGAAYAAYNERTPLMVVRGISDMRGGKDPEKDKIHQPIAAAHAAAFTFELLNKWGVYKPRSIKAIPEPAAQSSGPVPSPSTRTKSDPQGTQSRAVVILNLAGTAADFPKERVEQIQDALRIAINDPTLTVLRTEAGSFRIFLEGAEGTLQKIDVPEIREMLLREHSAKVLGVLDQSTFLAASAVDNVLQDASRDLIEWPKALPDGTHLQRPELGQLLSLIEEGESGTRVVLGPPGSGKSALLACVGQQLAVRRIPFLAIKADLLDPSIQTEEDLGKALSLPGPPSELLLQASYLRPVVLLIDQLDALAGYVDLRTGRLSVLLNLVRKLGDRRNIHVILSARTFEFEHDARLKSVRADSVPLSLPPWSDILSVLEGQGIPAAGWPGDAQELLRSPQILATFLKLKNRANQPPFRTYQSMLDQLWQERILEQPNGSNVAKLANAIAEQMAEREALWLAAAKFEEFAPELKALLSNQILTDDGSGGRIGFSHQTVFEHALARSFARGETRLSTYVLERQSSLFVRPKLWAALTYLREVEPTTYESDLVKMWSTEGLRTHLVHMLIEFLGQQQSPTSIEAGIFEGAISAEATRRVALQAMIGSEGWLKPLAFTHVDAAMRDKNEAHVAAAILGKAWSFDASLVKTLVDKNWIASGNFDEHLWSLLQSAPKWDDDLVRFTKTILARTTVAPFAFDQLISVVGAEAPAIALELASSKLTRDTNEAIKEAEGRAALTKPEDAQELMIWQMNNAPAKPLEKVLESSDGWEHMEAMAKDQPKLFLDFLWPRFVDVLLVLRRFKDHGHRLGFALPYILDFRFAGEHSLGLATPPLLSAFVTATETLASSNPDVFLHWLKAHEHEDATPAQRLFANALASQSEVYAERALEFLLADKRRFHLGGIEGSCATTKRLVRAVSPFWKESELETFADEVLSYAPTAPSEYEPKQRQRFGDAIRHIKLDLLTSLPTERLPNKVQRFISEERRRFPEEQRGATFHGPTWIGSPMSSASMSRANDADILNAFKEVPDASNWDHPKAWMKGGNIQLSREFAEFSKSSPERAVAIIRKFEPEFGARAAGYAIDAMAETGEPSILLALMSELDQRGFSGSEFRDSVSRAVERLIRRDVSIDDPTLDMLEMWLVEPVDAEITEDEDSAGLDIDTSNKENSLEGSVLWGHGGVTSLPHGNYPVLESITRVLLDRRDYDRLVAIYTKHSKTNEEQSVWLALFTFFRYIHPADPKAFGELVRDLFMRYPRFVQARESAMMLAYLHWKLPDVVHDIVAPWGISPDEFVQQAYGELVTLIAIVQPGLEWPQPLLKEIIESENATRARVGAAYAAVNVWPEQKYRPQASLVLNSIIPKADTLAWTAIVDIFRVVDEITPEQEWVTLLQTLSEHMHSADHIDSTYIVERLQTLLPHQAQLVAKIARLLVSKWRGELGDMRTATAMVARDMVDLAITLHRLGPETREVGTSLFEDLLVVNAYTARETMDEIDNRFRGGPRQERRRLRRRSKRPPPARAARN